MITTCRVELGVQQLKESFADSYSRAWPLVTYMVGLITSNSTAVVNPSMLHNFYTHYTFSKTVEADYPTAHTASSYKKRDDIMESDR